MMKLQLFPNGIRLNFEAHVRLQQTSIDDFISKRLVDARAAAAQQYCLFAISDVEIRDVHGIAGGPAGANNITRGPQWFKPMPGMTIHEVAPVVDLFFLNFTSGYTIYRRTIKRTDMMYRAAVAAPDESPVIHSCADGELMLRCR